MAIKTSRIVIQHKDIEDISVGEPDSVGIILIEQGEAEICLPFDDLVAALKVFSKQAKEE